MCVACIEFMKNKLNMKEYLAALWEATIEDKDHLSEVEEQIYQAGGLPEKLKEQLRAGGLDFLK